MEGISSYSCQRKPNCIRWTKERAALYVCPAPPGQSNGVTYCMAALCNGGRNINGRPLRMGPKWNQIKARWLHRTLRVALSLVGDSIFAGTQERLLTFTAPPPPWCCSSVWTSAYFMFLLYLQSGACDGAAPPICYSDLGLASRSSYNTVSWPLTPQGCLMIISGLISLCFRMNMDPIQRY